MYHLRGGSSPPSDTKTGEKSPKRTPLEHAGGPLEHVGRPTHPGCCCALSREAAMTAELIAPVIPSPGRRADMPRVRPAAVHPLPMAGPAASLSVPEDVVYGTVWVPRTVSLPLTWSSLMCAGSRTSVSGCASTAGSGTVSTHVTTIRLPGGAPRLRLARLARPLRPGQGRRDPPPAPPGRRAPAPGRDAEAVLARPGDLVRAGPAAAQRPPPPPAPDHLPAHPAALARRPGEAALGVPAAHPREAAHSAGHTGAGTGDGTGQPGLGIAASTVS